MLKLSPRRVRNSRGDALNAWTLVLNVNGVESVLVREGTTNSRLFTSYAEAIGAARSWARAMDHNVEVVGL